MTSPTFDNNAFEMLRALLEQWGLSSLHNDVRDMLTAGDSEEVIPLKLRETQTYKERFSGNAARIKAGLPALSEAEYLATESRLKTVVRRYVGSGEYDTKANLDKWIGGDLSPNELNDRMQVYQDKYLAWGDLERQAWASHGLTPAEAIKSIMDPSVTETTLKQKANVYALGAASVQAYKDDRALNVDRLGKLVNAGVTSDKATDGFREVAGRQEYEGFLARNAGIDLTREDQEDAALLNDTAARKKREKVLATDQAKYSENYLGGISALGRKADGSY